jgi:hypothetical protein
MAPVTADVNIGNALRFRNLQTVRLGIESNPEEIGSQVGL